MPKKREKVKTLLREFYIKEMENVDNPLWGRFYCAYNLAIIHAVIDPKTPFLGYRKPMNILPRGTGKDETDDGFDESIADALETQAARVARMLGEETV